ncbi:MAG: hypothetical protein ACHP8B_10930 [Terriglobales bacterium]
MRKAIGLVLVSIGAVVLAVYGVVMLLLHVPLPKSAMHFLGFNEFVLYVDPVIAPLCGGVALISGILVLRHGSAP